MLYFLFNADCNIKSELAFSEKVACIENRLICENESFISDKIKTTNSHNLEGFIATVDFEKTFYLLDHVL